MQIKRDFPYAVRVIDNTWILLADGTRLAARMWMPESDQPLPAILEYIPYRKNDGTAWRDSIRHPYLAGHGYICVRVDMRGNGDSDGLMLDEYLPQELADGVEVIEWIARQDWCDGNVGMFGKSWGGFNALQIAALRPESLKAIITVCSTDDRYADDVHYMGGALLASEMLPWAATMLCYNACPPDPRHVGDRWREMWLHRLENTPPFAEAWVAHQRRDEFWQHGSVCEDYSDIECAVYAVGGWADGYTNAIPRLLENLSCPRKGLIGPWAHNYPSNSNPQPSIGFMQESVRWWDYWLKGRDNDIMDEPMLTAYIQESYAPNANRPKAEGYWVSDTNWPSPAVTMQNVAWEIVDDHPLIGRQTTGRDSLRWLAFGNNGDYALDQRRDNGDSLCYTSAPQSATEMFGFPKVKLRLSVNQPQASLAIRLSDIAPDGAATLVTWGMLNLTHRNGHSAPEPVPTNSEIEVTVQLNVAGHRLAEGHRWCVAVSPTYWPHVWPAPNAVTLIVHSCQLSLPVRVGEVETDPFAPPEWAQPVELVRLQEKQRSRIQQYDVLTATETLTHFENSGIVRFPDGLEFGDHARDHWSICEGDPLSAWVECQRHRSFKRGAVHPESVEGWHVVIDTRSTMTCDATHFYLVNSVTAREGDTIVFERTWQKAIARDFQ